MGASTVEKQNGIVRVAGKEKGCISTQLLSAVLCCKADAKQQMKRRFSFQSRKIKSEVWHLMHAYIHTDIQI